MPPPPTLTSKTRATPGRAKPEWARDIRHRITHRFWLKTFGISAFVALFFIAYFHVLRNPGDPPLPMPLTAIDRAIPLQPAWLGVYLSLWFYVGVAPSLLLRVRDLLEYGAWAAALCMAGLACFYFWPTTVPSAVVDLARHPSFALLQGVDAPGNACPSMHVATAVFSAAAIEHGLRRLGAPLALRLLNLAWVLGIAYSTMAVRQHVFYDVLFGTMLGAAFAWAMLWRARWQ